MLTSPNLSDISSIKILIPDTKNFDPWTVDNEPIWCPQKVFFNSEVSGNELYFTLLSNPFDTYLRIYYTTNTSYLENYDMTIITPSQMDWYSNLTQYTKEIRVFFSESNEKPFQFPSKQFDRQINFSITASMFDNSEKSSNIEVLIDPTNIENLVSNFSLINTMSTDGKQVSVKLLKFIEGKEYALKLNSFFVLSNTEITGSYSLSNTKNVGGYWTLSFMRTITSKESICVFIPEKNASIEQGKSLAISSPDMSSNTIAQSSTYKIFTQSEIISHSLTADAQKDDLQKVIIIPLNTEKLDIILKSDYNEVNPFIALDDLNEVTTVFSYSSFPLFYLSSEVHQKFGVLGSLEGKERTIYPFSAKKVDIKSVTNDVPSVHITCNETNNCIFNTNNINTTYTITSANNTEVSGNISKLNSINSGAIQVNSSNPIIDIYSEAEDIHDYQFIRRVMLNNLTVTNYFVNFTVKDPEDQTYILLLSNIKSMNHYSGKCRNCNKATTRFSFIYTSGSLTLLIDTGLASWIIYLLSIFGGLILVIITICIWKRFSDRRFRNLESTNYSPLLT